MRLQVKKHLCQVMLLSWLCASVLALTGCGGGEETIGGIQVPIPRGMTKSSQQGIEVALPGFSGAQASYEGSIEPEKIMEYYKKEMPARGWQPAAGILSRGGMLSYTKEGRAVMIMAAPKNGKTGLTIMVGGAPR